LTQSKIRNKIYGALSPEESSLERNNRDGVRDKEKMGEGTKGGTIAGGESASTGGDRLKKGDTMSPEPHSYRVRWWKHRGSHAIRERKSCSEGSKILKGTRPANRWRETHLAPRGRGTGGMGVSNVAGSTLHESSS